MADATLNGYVEALESLGMKDLQVGTDEEGHYAALERGGSRFEPEGSKVAFISEGGKYSDEWARDHEKKYMKNAAEALKAAGIVSDYKWQACHRARINKGDKYIEDGQALMLTFAVPPEEVKRNIEEALKDVKESLSDKNGALEELYEKINAGLGKRYQKDTNRLGIPVGRIGYDRDSKIDVSGILSMMEEKGLIKKHGPMIGYGASRHSDFRTPLIEVLQPKALVAALGKGEYIPKDQEQVAKTRG